MTDKERAELYASALCDIIDQFGMGWRKPEDRAAEMYEIAIEALEDGK